MNTSYPHLPQPENRIVYVRAVAVSDLPEPVRARLGDLTVVYSVHGEDGETLALAANRNLAFALARQHDMAPVAVH